MKEPLVSVIVPTYNSSEFLEACLQSIKDQTYKNIELIVVDNNSTDNTKEIAKKFTKNVFNKGPERSAQRNYGVRKSSGTYVAIIDSDMELTEKVIEDCVSKASRTKNLGGVIIPEESFGRGFWAQCKKLERSFYVGVDWIEAARFYPKGLYVDLGGYNEAMVSGEDWDLSQRAAEVGKLARTNRFIMHNEGRLRLSKLLKKKYYYARNLSTYTESYQNNKMKHPNKQLSPVKRYWLFFSKPVLLFSRPHIGIGMLSMKSAEYLFGLFGILKNGERRR